MIRYLISDGTAVQDPNKWLRRIAQLIDAGVDFVQIREPELEARELAGITRGVLQLRTDQTRTRVLVNDRADVAIATCADGVHLKDGSIRPQPLKSIAPPEFVVSVASHDVEGARAAECGGADYIVLAPVFAPFSKTSPRRPLGLDKLREAARDVRVPVIALGGVTEANASLCAEAGAAGVAGISLFGGRR